MSEQGKTEVTYASRGKRRFQVEIWHSELNKHQVIRGTNKHEVEQKAREKMARWDQMWEREQCARQAVERTHEAQQALSILETILVPVLDMDHAVDWESLKDHSDYPVPKPEKPPPPKPGLFTTIVPAWQRNFERKVKEQQEEFKAAMVEWEEERAAYMKERDEGNAAVEEKKQRYLDGNPEAILDYCAMILSNSEYPEYFPQSYDLDYNPETKILVVDYQLPSVSSIPTIKEFRYIKSRDEVVEKRIPQSQLNKLYDQLLYQITLRTIHELYQADNVNALSSIVLNGYVHSIDSATGQEIEPCVLSIHTNREEFEQINLARAEPKACFRKLKGVGSSKLHSLTPIAPILKIERDDARFVPSYAVADSLEEGDNLAAMEWEDFEHLIRELFEKEFASYGGEVKVTRASRDKGVDAVAFDPDPIRGGKIVIQAKRYTITVDVSAVRDLYGTVLNEGASKGILVTTSDYGPDAYEFAKGKPLVLLNGSNLLHLLEKHGHKAMIDIQAARRILAEREKDQAV